MEKVTRANLADISQLAESVCDTCHGQGEVWTGENQSFGYMSMQPPEPIMEACPECGGEAEPIEPAGAQSYKDDPRTAAELSAAGCRCVRFGEGNPHWPCRIHAAPPQPERVSVPDVSELQRVIYRADAAAKRMLDAYSFWWSEIATIRVEFERFMRAAAPAAQLSEPERVSVPVEVARALLDDGRRTVTWAAQNELRAILASHAKTGKANP